MSEYKNPTHTFVKQGVYYFSILQLLLDGAIRCAIDMMEIKVFDNRAPISSLEITPIFSHDDFSF
jgi:hypothetical protein